MTKQVQRRRGTATQHTSFTGAEGEISVNTTNKSTHVHDGVTAGGIEAARADLDNVDAADVLAAAGITASATELNRVDGVTSPLQAQIDAKAPKSNATFTGSTTIPTADINGGTIDGTVIGGATPAAVTGTAITATGASVFASLDISGDLDVDGTTNLDVVDIDGAVNMATTAIVTGVLTTTAAAVFNGGFATAADVSFGDNDKAIFGAGSDLQIYHDGLTSIIKETGAGDLRLQGANIDFKSPSGQTYAYFNSTSGAAGLYYAGSQKLATTNTGVDITGTLTSDGLTVEAGIAQLELIDTGVSGSTKLRTANAQTWLEIDPDNVQASSGFSTYIDGKQFFQISSGGDISFYEDTGTTPKFFWDASAESLGIGTASPTGTLDVVGGLSGGQLNVSTTAPSVTGSKYGGLTVPHHTPAEEVFATIVGESNATGNVLRVGGGLGEYNAATNIAFYTAANNTTTAGTTRMTIDASGNVGIGTAIPTHNLAIVSAGNGTSFSNTTTSTAYNQALVVANAGGEVAITVDNNIGSALSAGNYGGQISSTNNLSFKAGGSERMRIDGATGNVGIGTASPSSLFMLSEAIVPRITMLKQGVIEWYIGNPTQSTSNNFSIGTSSGGRSEILTIDNTGNVMVGGTTAYATDALTISAGGVVDGKITNGPCAYFNRMTSDGTIVVLRREDVAVGSISVTASATAYNTSSDYRLKENVTPIQGAADTVMAMQPCTYTAIADGVWYDGFLAHELAEVHPRAVQGTKDAMQDEEYEVTPAVYEDVVTPAVDAVAATYDDEGLELTPAVEAAPETTENTLVTEAVMGTRSVPDMQSVDYSKLTPILTAALQEALTKIEALEVRLTALEVTP